MGSKLFLLITLIFYILFLGEREVGIIGKAFAQGEQRRVKPEKTPDVTDISLEILDVLTLEKKTPTSSQNLQERFRRLTHIVFKMLQAGKPAKDVLSKEDAQRIESSIKSGRMEEAVKMVHSTIMKLEKFVSFSDSEPFHKRMEIRDITPAPLLMKVNLKDLITKNNFGNILKLGNPVIDSGRRRLYFSGTKSTYIGIIDLDKDELIETFDIGIPGGFLLPDPKTGDIYLFDIGSNRFFKIDVINKKASEVFSLPTYLSLPKKGAPKVYKNDTYKDTGYPFKVGYLQDENAAYGVIEIKSSSGEGIGQIKHGPDGLYFDIDQMTGKLYATNTGDGSISIFDLNKSNIKIKDIPVGVSVDEIALNNKTNGIYTRNRLGGNIISYFDLDAKEITIIPNENTAGSNGIGMWPTQMIYDEDRLYILSHFGARIDVINSVTNKLITHIPVGLKTKPRTDNISTMVMDRGRKILYAAFPELGALAIVDVKNLKQIKILKIENFDVEKTNMNPGPAKIILSIDEKRCKLYIYLSEQKILNVYDTNSNILQKIIPIVVKSTERMMTSNPEKGILYFGNKILDSNTLEEKGTFAKGEKVISFDNAKNRVYLSAIIPTGPAKMIEKVYEFEDSILKREWTLTPILSIPSSFAFDFINNKFYAGYFESGVVDVFDLTTGGTPSTKLPNLSPPGREEGPEQNNDRSGTKGRCGDEICQPIEKEKGVCPEDCE